MLHHDNGEYVDWLGILHITPENIFLDQFAFKCNRCSYGDNQKLQEWIQENKTTVSETCKKISKLIIGKAFSHTNTDIEEFLPIQFPIAFRVTQPFDVVEIGLVLQPMLKGTINWFWKKT